MKGQIARVSRERSSLRHSTPRNRLGALADVCNLRRGDHFMVDVGRGLYNHRFCVYIDATRSGAIRWDLGRWFRAAGVSRLSRHAHILRTPDRSEEYESAQDENDPELECVAHTFTVLDALEEPRQYSN